MQIFNIANVLYVAKKLIINCLQLNESELMCILHLYPTIKLISNGLLCMYNKMSFDLTTGVLVEFNDMVGNYQMNPCN